MEKLTDLIHERISGKRILITGGSTGIGRATAILLAAQGGRVMFFGRHQEQVDEALLAIKSSGAKAECRGMAADVSDPEAIGRVFDKVDQLFGGIDILINNAAIAYQSVTDGSYADWQYVVQTNLTGYLACCHESIKRMQQQPFAHIVNIGSMSADVREENSSVYVATKSAIQGFSEALRKEVNPMGIKVTLIEPGAVDTDMQPGTREEKLEKIKRMEMLKAEDIAYGVLFCLAQPPRTDVIHMQIRPHLQLI